MSEKGRGGSPVGSSLALASVLAELAEATGIGLRLFRGWRPTGMEPAPESHCDENRTEGLTQDPEE